MIFIDWFQVIWEFLQFVFKNDKIQKTEDLTNYIIGFINFCFTLLIPITVYYLIDSPFSFIYEHFKNLSWQLIWEKTDLEMVFIFIIDFVILLSLFCFKAKIKKIEKIEDFLSQNIKTMLSNIYSELLITKSLVKFNYEISFKYFSEWFKVKESYTEFIRSFQETTSLSIIPLDEIAKVAKNSLNGKFSCVISYDEYFNNKDSVIKMIGYFASFYESVNNKHNKIERIFTQPGTFNKGSNLYQTILPGDKRYYTLLYLIINKVCLVDTFLFIYSESCKDLDSKFFRKSDYVIAYPSSKNDQYIADKSEIELFFAYPNNEGDPKDSEEKALRTKDTFFVRIFEMEYRNRLKLSPADETKTTFIPFNLYNYPKILLMLKIDRVKDKERVNKCISMMERYITSNSTLSDEVKKILTKKIKRWKLR